MPHKKLALTIIIQKIDTAHKQKSTSGEMLSLSMNSSLYQLPPHYKITKPFPLRSFIFIYRKQTFQRS